MPTICARLGRFMLTRYFSIHSPSCFCAPAVAPPTWFITLENSGDDMAWLAKELNPFSISPTIFCHMATGSLVLSVIGRPPEIESCDAPLFAPYHTVARCRSTGRSSSAAHTASLRRETVRYSIDQQEGPRP